MCVCRHKVHCSNGTQQTRRIRNSVCAHNFPPPRGARSIQTAAHVIRLYAPSASAHECSIVTCISACDHKLPQHCAIGMSVTTTTMCDPFLPVSIRIGHNTVVHVVVYHTAECVVQVRGSRASLCVPFNIRRRNYISPIGSHGFTS